MASEMEALIRRLVDLQEIEAALHRYCRGVDRLDKELMLSAYHVDAIDDHGIVVLPADKFCDWAINYHATNNQITHHAITNVSIDLDGDLAHSECYYSYFGTIENAKSQLAFGRYVDRHERRDGRWAIAARMCFTEAVEEIDRAILPEAYQRLMQSNGPQTRDRGDASYHRPLLIDPARLPVVGDQDEG